MEKNGPNDFEYLPSSWSVVRLWFFDSSPREWEFFKSL